MPWRAYVRASLATAGLQGLQGALARRPLSDTCSHAARWCAGRLRQYQAPHCDCGCSESLAPLSLACCLLVPYKPLAPSSRLFYERHLHGSSADRQSLAQTFLLFGSTIPELSPSPWQSKEEANQGSQRCIDSSIWHRRRHVASHRCRRVGLLPVVITGSCTLSTALASSRTARLSSKTWTTMKPES